MLEPLLAKTGVLTKRAPTEQERKNIDYGRAVARHLAQYDIGQTVVIAESACVAVEAMEGTDATIERAGQLMRSLEGDASTLSRSLTVVKIAKPHQDMRFDVPVIGVKTIETMQRAGASCLAVDAGRCLLLDGEATLRAADDCRDQSVRELISLRLGRVLSGLSAWRRLGSVFCAALLYARLRS